MRWRIDPRTAWQNVGGRSVVLDLAGGAAIGLNETGTFVWTRLSRLTDEEIADELAREFRLPRQKATEDVSTFMAEMTRRGLVICDC